MSEADLSSFMAARKAKKGGKAKFKGFSANKVLNEEAGSTTGSGAGDDAAPMADRKPRLGMDLDDDIDVGEDRVVATTVIDGVAVDDEEEEDQDAILERERELALIAQREEEEKQETDMMAKQEKKKKPTGGKLGGTLGGGDGGLWVDDDSKKRRGGKGRRFVGAGKGVAALSEPKGDDKPLGKGGIESDSVRKAFHMTRKQALDAAEAKEREQDEPEKADSGAQPEAAPSESAEEPARKTWTSSRVLRQRGGLSGSLGGGRRLGAGVAAADGTAALKQLGSEQVFPSLGPAAPQSSAPGTGTAASGAWGRLANDAVRAAEEEQRAFREATEKVEAEQRAREEAVRKAKADAERAANPPVYLGADFLAAAKFEGSKPGYEFRAGKQGTGYYWSEMEEGEEEAPEPEDTRTEEEKKADEDFFKKAAAKSAAWKPKRATAAEPVGSATPAASAANPPKEDDAAAGDDAAAAAAADADADADDDDPFAGMKKKKKKSKKKAGEEGAEEE